MSDKNKIDEECTSETEAAQQVAESQEQQTQEQTDHSEQTAPEKTQEQLLEEEIAQLNDRLLRTMAEYANFRKRSAKEKDAIYPQAKADTVAAFVPIMDTFERALCAPCTDESFKTGVEMILHNFKEVLTKLGVEEFGENGDLFDPSLHNAVLHIEDESLDSNVIVEVFQKGYKLEERIIRHAMVKVAN